MNLNLTGRTALVCGGSQGLGAAIASELALLGANLIVLARREAVLQNFVATLDQTQGQTHEWIAADAHEPDLLVSKIKERLQKGAIEILINNTGGPAAGPLLATKVLDLEKAFQAHLSVSHLLTQALVPGMKAAGFGRIVNVLSTSVKQPIDGLGISNTVRSAVANWAKTMANELGSFGITVNNVLPGYTNTQRLQYLFANQAEKTGLLQEAILNKTVALIPAGRLGEPEEFGAAVAFLCSPAAAYINGINLPVDGGRLSGL
ncbi:MAG: short-chain dehydrogenase [Bacteroidetes bacterium 24-39-8]|jgi:3-oxoacyl-[acyl-carrier protein] reductase|nr:MAG: short-chain dehydrogenase [Sphingobacteriia bacterium 35-40-8]OYZ48191.1 MAG: short-chain dehydrogenase [Bacteroidetes bacterium 24-39-8]OZA63553.1 MAG: short-chain dehydrogenase [Sphingobacteriia bacterium 39-39-8]HQR93123.1 SDR family oxidoreductase [Sediminibacterium sp.]HQS55461.1 SDR family oxidoreductase [Sediminibacterium sp.]